MSKSKDIYSILSNFGTYTCNVAHDINNFLAISAGYTEELGEMLANGNLDVEMLTMIHKKLSKANEKLGARAEDLAAQRRKSGKDLVVFEMHDYLHRFIKTSAPLFETWNMKFLFSSEGDSHYEAKYLDIQQMLCDFFGQWFENINLKEVQTIKLHMKCEKDQFTLHFTQAQGLPVPPPFVFNGSPFNIQTIQDGYSVTIPCKSAPAPAKSAA